MDVTVCGPLSIVDAAGVAALFGSVSSVTFLVARAYAEAAGAPMDGYVTGLVALMELGILVALFYGRIALSRADGKTGVALGAILLETLRGRGLLLLGGDWRCLGRGEFRQDRAVFRRSVPGCAGLVPAGDGHDGKTPTQRLCPGWRANAGLWPLPTDGQWIYRQWPCHSGGAADGIGLCFGNSRGIGKLY